MQQDPLLYAAQYAVSWLFGSEDCDDNLTDVCLELNLINQLLVNNTRPDEAFVESLNQSEILRLVNLRQEKDLREGTNLVEKYLGDIKRDKDGLIIGATATKIDLITQTNITEALLDPILSQSSPVTKTSVLFEEELRTTLLQANENTKDFQISVFVPVSYTHLTLPTKRIE